jgi:hypothetical protein
MLSAQIASRESRLYSVLADMDEHFCSLGSKVCCNCGVAIRRLHLSISMYQLEDDHLRQPDTKPPYAIPASHWNTANQQFWEI